MKGRKGKVVNDSTQNTIEQIRKWGTTVMIPVIILVGSLLIKSTKLEIMAEVQGMYVGRGQNDIDRKELALRLDKIDSKVEAVGIKLDAVLQNQEGTREHLKTIDSKVNGNGNK